MTSDVVGAQGSNAQQTLQSFWPSVMEEIRNVNVDYFREQQLPVARIKKIMKMDEDVKMVSAEVPVMFAKAAEIFITELTLRAWIHTEDSRRRTMQRSDVAMAITKFDQFDFLIDIVPQYEQKPPKQLDEARQSAEPAQYFFSLAQQPGAVPVHGPQQGQQVNTQTATTIQPGQVIIAQHLQVQVQSQGTPITSAPVPMPVGEGQQVQNVQMAEAHGQTQAAQAQGQTMQGMQQLMTNTGEIHQIPMPLNNMGQLQYLRLAQPVPGTQVGRGQIQTLASTQQITQTEQQGQHCWQNCYWPSSRSSR